MFYLKLLGVSLHTPMVILRTIANIAVFVLPFMILLFLSPLIDLSTSMITSNISNGL